MLPHSQVLMLTAAVRVKPRHRQHDERRRHGYRESGLSRGYREFNQPGLRGEVSTRLVSFSQNQPIRARFRRQ